MVVTGVPNVTQATNAITVIVHLTSTEYQDLLAALDNAIGEAYDYGANAYGDKFTKLYNSLKAI